MLYLWLKALHVVAIIAWMAGMLYLPRLFVYHAETEKGSVRSETFKIMERRLLKAIINPAMIAAWVLGLYLVIEGGWWRSGWMHAQIRARGRVIGGARPVLALAQGLRRRPQHPPGAVLPDVERGPDAAHDRHRDPGDRQAVLISEACMLIMQHSEITSVE